MNHVWVVERNRCFFYAAPSRQAARVRRSVFRKKGEPTDKWQVVQYSSEPELLSIIKRITAEFNEVKKKNRALETELLDACRRNDKLREEIKRLKRKADLDGVNT